MTDLFEKWDSLPKKVKDILNKYSDKQDYISCEKMLNELKPLGYTFEYYLDAIPYNLTTIKK